MTGLPNTFMTFNIYVDRAMELLTDSEFRVLMFATRHILGWQDKVSTRAGAISLSRFENGFTSSNGNRFGGCGLSRPAIITAISKLVEFGLLKKEGIPSSDGQAYTLQTDGVNWKMMEERATLTQQSKSLRTVKARESIGKGGKSDNTGKSDSTTPGQSDNTPPGKSDSTHKRQDTNPISKTEEQTAPNVAASQSALQSAAVATKPSDNVTGKHLKQDPPTSAPPPKPNTKEGKFRAEWCAHEQRGEAFLKACGSNGMVRASEMPRSALEPHLDAAKQMHNAPVEHIALLGKYVADKAKAGNWSGFGPLTLVKYYPEFLQSLQTKPVVTRTSKLFEDTPEPPPLTEEQKAEVKAGLAQARALMGAT